MSLYRLQGKAEKRRGIFYEFDSAEEPLGVGGMGKVYKGWCVDENTHSRKLVAVKFMFDELQWQAPQTIERARREASIQIKHENLVEMLGFIETEEKNVIGEVQKHYHVVSELLEGIMLDDLLQGRIVDRTGRIMPFAQKLYNDYQRDVNHFAIYIIRSVLSGLMALHDAGYIHRDIDPTNIMITSDGHVKLIDFGIAKQLRSLTSHDKSLTNAGAFIGKPEYAAPELVLGDIGHQNQTTDIYAVGILLFQCIVGHPPFEGDKQAVLHMQIHKKPPLHLIKNKHIRKIIAKAVEKSREKRYASAAEFRVAIDHLPTPLSNNGHWWDDSVPLKYVEYIAAVVIAISVIVVGWKQLKPPPQPPHPQLVAEVTNHESDSQSANHVIDAYAQAVSRLYKKESASDGIMELLALSESGNSEASYLLSRLYFKSLAAQDFCPDSIIEMRNNAELSINNKKAQELLLLAVRQDSSNYKALYELGCDFYGGSSRASEYKRNLAEALKLFREAGKYAKEAEDHEFVRSINTNIQKLENIVR